MSPQADQTEWIPVTSSHVARIAWKPDEALILIEFLNGDMWEYPAHPDEWDGLRNAQSVGKYVNYFFKGRGRRVS